MPCGWYNSSWTVPIFVLWLCTATAKSIPATVLSALFVPSAQWLGFDLARNVLCTSQGRRFSYLSPTYLRTAGVVPVRGQTCGGPKWGTDPVYQVTAGKQVRSKKQTRCSARV
eukprot:2720313-Rhodomonas_salina.1